MNPIDRSARYLACSIRRNYPDAGSEKALFYTLCLLINSSTCVSVVLIIALITHHFLEAVVAIAAYTLLRYFSGGAHTNSSLSCCLLSTFIFLTASHSTFSFWPYGFMLNSFALIILVITAPNNIENVSRVDKKYYKHLKVISVLIVASNFFFHSSVLAAAFIAQAFLTTKHGHFTLNFISKEEGKT